MIGRRKSESQIVIEDRFIAVDGLEWRYRDAGSGPALLLVHGLLGHSFSWRNSIPVLARHASVYAMDLPGSGYSAAPIEDNCSLRATAQRLLRFMDALNISQCDILGSSYGGAVALMAAGLAPQRFRRLLLAAPVNPWSAHGKRFAPFVCHPLVAPVLLRVLPRLTMLHEFYFRRLFGDTRRIPPGTLAGYIGPLLRCGTLRHTLRVLRSWNHDLEELRAILPRIAHIPVLLLWGSVDAAVDPASGRELRKHFKHCRLLTMEGIGHLPYEESPEEFNRAITEFLARTS